MVYDAVNTSRKASSAAFDSFTNIFWIHYPISRTLFLYKIAFLRVSLNIIMKLLVSTLFYGFNMLDKIELVTTVL